MIRWLFILLLIWVVALLITIPLSPKGSFSKLRSLFRNLKYLAVLIFAYVAGGFGWTLARAITGSPAQDSTYAIIGAVLGASCGAAAGIWLFVWKRRRKAHAVDSRNEPRP